MEVEKFNYDNKVVKYFAYATIIWGIIGMLVGLIAALPATIATGDAVVDATWNGANGSPGIYQTAAGIAAQQELDVSAVTVGLRYDVEPGFALKTDVTWYSDDLNDLNDATLLKVGVNYTF